MNTTLNTDLHLSSLHPDMSEVISEDNEIQSLRITSVDIDIEHEDKHLLSNEENPLTNKDFTSLDDQPELTQSNSNPNSNTMTKKQKSLVSVYDNSNENDESIVVASPPNRTCSLPLVGIIGRNRRAEAFRKRLIFSDFPSPILCDIDQIDVNSTEKTVFVSHETFFNSSPSIILISENLSTNFQHLLRPDKEYLIVDGREMTEKENSPLIFPFAPIQRAFGNLSDWEIENGTERVGVSIEQNSTKELIEFMKKFQCFPRPLRFLDSFSYSDQQRNSFHRFFFPIVSTTIIFSLAFIISLIEHQYRSSNVFRQASSISGATSLTLLAFLLLIRPKLEMFEFCFSIVEKTSKIQRQTTILQTKFIRHWLQCRDRLAWFSFGFAVLHVLFLLLTQIDLNTSSTTIIGVFFGIFTLIFIFIFSFAHLPWISERLVWREYRFLTSFLPPFCLLMAFIHVFLHWHNELTKAHRKFFTLKFLSMILPTFVLILRLILYGLIRPLLKLIRLIEKHRISKSKSTLTKDSSLLMA